MTPSGSSRRPRTAFVPSGENLPCDDTSIANPEHSDSADGMNSDVVMRPFSTFHLTLGESPRWDASRECVWAVDIPAGRLVGVNLRGETTHSAHFDAELPSVCVAGDTSLALVRRDGLFRYMPETLKVEQIADPPYDPSTHTFNDCGVDPGGQLWVGVAAADETVGEGSLHRWTARTGFAQIQSSMTLPNGLGWEQAGAWHATVDSVQRIVTITPDGSEDVSTWNVPVEFGLADGLTVDGSGDIWIAYWDGSCIRRHAATGEVLQHIAMPVARVTAPLLIAIPGRTVLVVTTAQGSQTLNSMDGTDEGRLFIGDVDTSAGPTNLLDWS